MRISSLLEVASQTTRDCARGYALISGWSKSRSPSRARFNPVFGWEGSPTKIDYSRRKKIGSPYSNLSTGGPSWVRFNWLFVKHSVAPSASKSVGPATPRFPTAPLEHHPTKRDLWVCL